MSTTNTKEIIIDGVDALAGTGSLFFPPLATVPLINYVINRVLGLMRPDDILKRLKRLEKKLYLKKITIEKFKYKIDKLNEHDRYVFAKNLNNILINCIPETVDIYISVLVDMIMDENEKNPKEEICEIISQLNKNDLITLQMIKEYRKNGSRDYYYQNIKKQEIIEENNKKIREENKMQELKNEQIREENKKGKIKKLEKLMMPEYHDRNLRIEDKTIFWKDFIKTFNLEVQERGLPLLFETINEKNETSMDWAYIIRSFIKLESLGILNFDYLTTLGTSNNLNIDRFHISIFGEMLLEYI